MFAPSRAVAKLLAACPVLMENAALAIGSKGRPWGPLIELAFVGATWDSVRRCEKGVEEVILKSGFLKTFHQPFINSRLDSPPIRLKARHRSHIDQ